MKIEIEYTESELKELIIKDLEEKLGEISFNPNNLKIEVKSTQNYKSVWEKAAFKARYTK